MISIIVCSVNICLYNKFEENVKSSIGFEYEILRIDNSIENKGICEVYNNGLAKAEGSVICFCHEDIIFNTQDWGSELNALLLNKDIGLVGVAGAVYKSKYPSPWMAIPQEYYRVNMTQVTKDGPKFTVKILDEGSFSEVAILDGCLIAGRKEVFDAYKWNQKDLPGFHLYDLDLSIRVKEAYKLVVANNIQITHLSEGDFGLDWLNASENFHHANKKLLPVSVMKLSNKEQDNLDYFGLHAHINKLKQLKQPRLNIYRLALKAIFLFPLRKQNVSLLKICIVAL